MSTTDKAIGFIRQHYKLIEGAATRQVAHNHRVYVEGLIVMGSMYGPLDHKLEGLLLEEVNNTFQGVLTELRANSNIATTEQAATV